MFDFRPNLEFFSQPEATVEGSVADSRTVNLLEILGSAIFVLYGSEKVAVRRHGV